MISRLAVYLFFFLILFSAVRIDAEEGRVCITNFNKETNGMPSSWQIKEWKGRADVRIISEDIGQVLCLKSSGTSTALYKDFEIDVKEKPYITWQWKVTKLPEKGDVRNGSTDDQASQVYVIFPKFPSQINSRVIGYIWDTNAPQGSVVTSTKFSKTRYIVLRSGSEGLGKWFIEKRNVYEDYKMLFDEEPPNMGKIAIMIDSDDTKGSAESFVSEIYLSKN